MKSQRASIVAAAAVMFGALAATGLGCELVAAVDRSLIEGGADAGDSGSGGSTTVSSSTGMMVGSGGMGGVGGGAGGGTGGTGGAMPSCSDMTHNGMETDVDCGGPDCPQCMNGDMCGVNSDCVSNNCMGGTCAPPGPTCTDTMQNGMETDTDCGGPTCPQCMNGDTCIANSDCVSNNCDTGTCAPPPATCTDTMQNGMETDTDCGGPVCPQCMNGDSCMAGSDCTSDYCKANVCSAKESNGAACADASVCASGFCADGFCCVSACNGTCQTCAQSEGSPQNGTCSNVANGTDPNDSCSDEGPLTCGNDGMCNSAGQCRKYSAGTTCGDAQACMNGVETKQDTCNGVGACMNNGTVTCGAYVCDAMTMACKTMCSDPADCASGFTCNAGVCKRLNGGPCANGSQCDSGNCVDGVCCNSTCTATCMACNVTGSLGTCSNVPVSGTDTTCMGVNACNGSGTCLLANGQACTMSSQCASNNCDGVAMVCAP